MRDVYKDPKLERRIKYLFENLPELIRNFQYRKGPDLYFYQKTIALRRRNLLVELFDDKTDRFLELIYATLASWNMNTRGAKMKYFDGFKSSILANRKKIHASIITCIRQPLRKRV